MYNRVYLREKQGEGVNSGNCANSLFERELETRWESNFCFNRKDERRLIRSQLSLIAKWRYVSPRKRRKPRAIENVTRRSGRSFVLFPFFLFFFHRTAFNADLTSCFEKKKKKREILKREGKKKNYTHTIHAQRRRTRLHNSWKFYEYANAYVLIQRITVWTNGPSTNAIIQRRL